MRWRKCENAMARIRERDNIYSTRRKLENGRKCLSKVLSKAQLRDLDYARPDPERGLGRVRLFGDHHGFKQAPAEPQLSSVMPGWSPGESRQRSCRAPVNRNSTDTHRSYTGIRPWQSYGLTTVVAGNAQAEPR
ncbi:hypothetical protein DPMN_037962 [Dreissena polymorpha]|uniref:Uncharacterized protein n=1 Tax=Dreissena polymorpha TaxID=45954 RepID=A0A9D4RN89_DREPO|nr:hypothetical protein DPMN_037962 [Dreissena polymorpha]